MFAIQEKFIRTRFPSLLNELPILANKLAEKINQKIGEAEILDIQLTGKVNNNFELGQEQSAADLLVFTSKKTIALSIKLSKFGAYVNTKSGGIKSFMQKYFPYADSTILQEQLNHELDLCYESAMMELHQCMDVEYDATFCNWRQMGLTELPGELPAEAREIMHSLYGKLAKLIEKYMSELQKKDPKKFVECLAPLLGISSGNSIQAICYYVNRQGSYELSDLFCKNGEEITQELSQFQFSYCNDIKSSFELKFPSKVLQIRVKPMNKFTAMAFKINCSVKHFNQLS